MELPNLNRLVAESLPDDLPRVLPVGWKRQKDHTFAGKCAVFKHTNGLLVIYSKSTDSVTGEWLHISISYDLTPPDWHQVMLVKNLFWGENAVAVQVIPAEEDEIDIAHCHHIWKRPA